MTDELKPELKDQLDKLPRERMPAGLEARVTGAMRQHGFLEKRRRVVAVTSARVAGLIAACVALVIGGYSIGLQRGGGEGAYREILQPVTVDRDSAGRTEAPAVPTDVKTTKKEVPAADEPVLDEAESAPAAQRQRQQEPQRMSQEKGLTDKDDRAAAATERDAEAPVEGRSYVQEEAAAPPARSEVGTLESKSLSAQRPQTTGAADATSNVTVWPQRLFLNGFPILLEAPDSVRVVQEERGRLLLIYTSDGVIRIRAADDN
jgi:type IV secretory pathway VirB10-like protein